MKDGLYNAMNPRFSRGDKVATGIARTIAFGIGLALLFAFAVGGIWRTADIKGWLTFCALIGLCLGYGIGGDALGARLFNVFSSSNFSREANASPPNILQKLTWTLLLGMLFLLIGVAVFLWLKR